MVTGVLQAADGLALSMIGILALSFGMVALLAYGIYRSGKRGETEVDALLEELRQETEAEEKAPAAPGSTLETREPWERDSDWWKPS